MDRCRPFAGAWIETCVVSVLWMVAPGRPFAGAWIETTRICPVYITTEVAPSRGRGLKPFIGVTTGGSVVSPLRGGVD